MSLPYDIMTIKHTLCVMLYLDVLIRDPSLIRVTSHNNVITIQYHDSDTYTFYPPSVFCTTNHYLSIHLSIQHSILYLSWKQFPSFISGISVSLYIYSRAKKHEELLELNPIELDWIELGIYCIPVPVEFGYRPHILGCTSINGLLVQECKIQSTRSFW